MTSLEAPQPPAREGSSDLLSEVLQDLRLARSSYCRAELSAPWGLEMAFQEGVRFHFVVQGRCWLRAESIAPVLLEEGDVILLPHGSSHVLDDGAGGRATPMAEAGPVMVGTGTYRLRAGGGGVPALIVCCTIAFDGPTAHPLLQMLPPVLHVRRTEGDDPRLATLLDLMAEEVAQQRIGAATVMARLADIALTRIVRAWVESRDTELGGWLAAVKDPRIGGALAAIHRAPGEAWSVERLAATARLSRSTFSKRFSILLGVSPGQYLLTWRMRLATSWLRREDLPLAEIAARLGYESEASFSRAYKRSTGRPPGASRRRPGG